MANEKVLYTVLAVLLAFGAATGVEASRSAAVLGDDGIQRIDVTGGSYFFKPDRIVVKVDTPVELKASKESGIVPHDIVAQSPAAGIVFQESLSSSPKTIQFTPTRVGTYSFYCSKDVPFFESHREKGMEGVIEVVP